jgi:membrane fusion protein, copper/silver efflux system
VKKVIFLVILVLIIAGSYFVGSWHTRQAAPRNTQAMMPFGGDEEDLPPGTVKVSPEKQQMIGVRVGLAERRGTTHTIRAFGRVAADENRIHRVVAPVEGWVVDLVGGTTGSLVAKDQILCKISGRDIFNRDIVSGQQAYFLALNTLDHRKKSDHVPEEQMAAAAQQVLTAEKNLEAIGMGETQIKELERTRKLVREIEIRAPVTGFVLARNVSPKLRFDRNLELYRIADLGRVWILADIFENEAVYFKPGIQARVTLAHLKKTFQARVSRVLPLFDAASQTLKVRMEVDNPGFTLRPDMFVDVEFPIQLPPALTVPVNAVFDTGLRKTVFVDRGRGFFEPREVETGWRLGNRVEITKGLAQGERIVTSGTFLIDSESRMELAADGESGSLAKDPVSGMVVSIRKAEKAGLKSTYQQKVYYFASVEHRARFNQDPSRYLQKP